MMHLGNICLEFLLFFLIQVGWSTTKDYHTFVWVEPCQDVTGQQSVTKQAVFKGKTQFHFYCCGVIVCCHVYDAHCRPEVSAGVEEILRSFT